MKNKPKRGGDNIDIIVGKKYRFVSKNIDTIVTITERPGRINCKKYTDLGFTVREIATPNSNGYYYMFVW